jgi:transcriptional regulator with XRE-family HTH domain
MTTRARRRLTAQRQPVETIYQEVGELIRAVRVARGQTVVDVADALGVSRQQLGSWESGRYRIPLHRLDELAALWGTTLAVLTPERASLALMPFLLSARPQDLASLRHLADQVGD